MYKRILLRLAPIQLLLLMAVSCTPEATAPLLDSDAESTANYKGNDGDSYAKTKGLIAEIDDEGMRVRVGDDWFWTDDDTKIKIDDFEGTPTFDNLQVDDPVHIEHRTVADEDKGYYAREIKVVDDDDDEVKYAKTEGYVEEVDADGMRFRIGEDVWFWVDENTRYCDDDDDDEDNGHLTCSFDDVQVGVWVKVKHLMQMEEDKGYYARQVVVKPNHQFAWAEGYVQEVDQDGMRFRVGEDMWFWVDEHTQYCDDDDDADNDHLTCSFDDVQVGAWVKTKYRTFLNEDQGYYAMKVLVKPNHQFAWAEGYVEEVDADGMRFRIGDDMWFWVDENTHYCDDDDDDDDNAHLTCSFEDVQVGVWVKTKYRTFLHEDQGYYAMKVLVKLNKQFAWAEGEVEEVDADGMRFRIGEDTWFWVDEHTQYCDDDDYDDDEACWSFDDVQVGVWAKVRYRTFMVEDRGYYAGKVLLKFGHESVEGEVAEVDGDGMRIKVGDDWFWADEHTEISIEGFEEDPTFGDIETGDLVKIEYRTPAYEDKGFYAKKIEVKTG